MESVDLAPVANSGISKTNYASNVQMLLLNVLHALVLKERAQLVLKHTSWRVTSHAVALAGKQKLGTFVKRFNLVQLASITTEIRTVLPVTITVQPVRMWLPSAPPAKLGSLEINLIWLSASLATIQLGPSRTIHKKSVLPILTTPTESYRHLTLTASLLTGVIYQ